MLDPSPHFTLRQLELFLATVRTGSFAAAAKELFVTPAAVAVAVNDLEKNLGVQLLIRQRARGVRPTAAGTHLVERARTLLGDANEIELALSSGGQLSGPVSVGCYSTLAGTVLPALIDGFSREHPEVDLHIADAPLLELVDRLFAGELDVVIGYRLNLPAGLEIEILYETEVHALLAASHPLAEEPHVSLRDLAGDPLIMLDLPPSGRHTLDLLYQEGVNPQVAYRSSNFEFVRSMVARGLGYSLLIQKARLDRSYEGLPLVAKPIRPQFSKEWAVIVWPQDAKLTDRARAFVEYARAHVAPELHMPMPPAMGDRPSVPESGADEAQRAGIHGDLDS